MAGRYTRHGCESAPRCSVLGNSMELFRTDVLRRECHPYGICASISPVPSAYALGYPTSPLRGFVAASGSCGCGSVCCGSVRAAGLCELRVCGSVRLRVYAAAPRLCCCQASRLAYAAMWRLRGVVSCREKSRGRCGRSHGGQWGRTAEGWTVCRLRACTANAIGPGFAILAMRVVGNGSEVSKVSTAAGSRVRRI